MIGRGVCLALALLALTDLASAQNGEEPGIRAGPLVFTPSIGVSTQYDTNVFLSDTNETETFLFTVAPRLEVRTDWNRHGLKLETGARYGFFTHDGDDNFLDYDARLAGVLDITRRHRLVGSAEYRRAHDGRGSTDAPGNIAEPVVWTSFAADLRGEAEFNFFEIIPFARFEALDFQDAPVVGGGLNNQDDRDRTDFEAGLEVAYAVRRGYRAFLSGTYLRTDYEDPVDDFGVNRDSEGWRVLAGVRLELSELLQGSVGAGVTHRSYADATLQDATGFAVDAQLIWAPTRRLSVFANAGRDVQETTIAGASGTLTTELELGATYELLRTLSLTGALSYAQLEFDGANRTDQVFGVDLSADWAVNRKLTITPAYRFSMRRSDAPALDYTRHQGTVTAAYRF